MTIKQIYDLAIRMGIKADPRGEKKVIEIMKRKKVQYEKMSKEEKRYYDKEKLNNPYPDAMTFVGAPDKKIKKALVGIDIDTPEILLADRLGNIDLVISHHPEWPYVPEAMDMQIDFYSKYGVPVNIAEWITKEWSKEVERSTKPLNHARTIDAAKLLDLSLIAPHSCMDNLAHSYIDRLLKSKNPEYIEDILDILMKIPEYQIAAKQGYGPSLFTGDKSNRVGKIIVEFTGGTSPSDKIYEKLSQAGIGTSVSMHIRKNSRKEAEKYHMNIVIAGHYASDSLGTNLFLDEIEKNGIEIIPCSGLIRVKRFK
ncbi:MAG: NGG1p interacting factor NIF3 [Candidatus Pacebacteria bacterium]|nr:NGG1p interacting factor NIF3 [Candidatus Paceibacterota bacterium]